MVEKSKKYKKGRQISFQVILAGVFIWIFDTIMDYFFFYEGNSFWDLLILDIPTHELYIRLSFFIVLTVLGYIIYIQFKNQENLFISRIKIEEDLIQSQKKLNTIFQAIPDLYFMISRDGTYLEYKGQEGDLYVPPETFLGKKAKDFMPKELFERINVAIPKLYNTKQPQTIEYSLQMPDGKKRYFQSQMLYFSEEKHVSFTKDITENKLNEQKLKKSEHNLKERYKELDCIYKISQLQDETNLSLENLFKKSIEIIIKAFQFPDIACSKIKYREKLYFSENFKETDWKLSESIKIDNNIIVVTVNYLENKQFLHEEVLLLKNIINRFKNIIENKNSEEIRRDFNKKLEEEVITKTEELLVVRDQLNSIWDNLIDPIIVISEDYRILFSNKSAQNAFGKNLNGSLCYEKIKGINNPCDFCHLYPGKEIVIFDTLIEHEIKIPNSGEVKTFEISISKIKNFQGKPAMLETLRDINERKKIEHKLKESEFISQERVKELDSLYGISRLLAKPNISINRLLRDSIPLILRVWPNPEKTNVRIAYGLYEHKSENFKETLWKLSTLEFIGNNTLKIDVFSQDEDSLHIEKINVLKEIGDRIHMSISRREVELEKNKYVSIVRDSNDAIIVSDLKGTITGWNKSAEIIYGYTAEEIIGNSLISLIPPDRIDENSFIISEIRKGNHIDHYETKRLRKDGKILDISITASPIKNLINEIIGLSAISRDFTEVNEQQNLFKEEILKSSQFKSDFMSSMSHELRTPLNSIIGFSDILLEKYYGDLNEKQYHYVNNVRTSADHLLNLINDILDISKIEAGKMELNIENIHLNNIINTVENTLRPEFKKKNLKFDVIGLDDKNIIQADSVRLQEIMFNLLSNAVKYTKEGGIKLEIIESQDFWTFNIKDTGVGIKEEDFDLVFQEFKRIKSDFIASIEGTGLGLSLTKKLVELHGGNISFTSDYGKGSTFTFSLPKINISIE
jgi:PAS domain S-box-containing protein